MKCGLLLFHSSAQSLAVRASGRETLIADQEMASYDPDVTSKTNLQLKERATSDRAQLGLQGTGTK